MAELTTLARPYAKAAFEVALEAGALESWSKMLGMSAAVTRDEAVSALLKSPSLTSEQVADAFVQVCGDELDAKGKNFVRLLAENRRLVLLPQIAQLFEVLKANQEKSVDVEVTTAFEISSDITSKLAQALKSRLKREINMVTRIDQTLIGGVVIRAGDTVIDSSVRGKLSKLAESMKS